MSMALLFLGFRGSDRAHLLLFLGFGGSDRAHLLLFLFFFKSM